MNNSAPLVNGKPQAHMPNLTINLNENSGETTLKFLFEDFLAETPTNGSCFFDLRIMYVEKTGPLSYKHSDYMIVGADFFKRYIGLHYNFETSRVAFSGRREPAKPFDPIPKVESNVLAVILILVIPIVFSFFFYFLSKRNERIKGDLERYETLFGKEEKKGGKK
jgi:hypothetical protein